MHGISKKGYKVVVPRQNGIWCCHDGLCSNLAAYFDYYERFIQEYGGSYYTFVRNEEEILSCKTHKEYAQQILLLKKSIEELFDSGEKKALRKFFRDPEFQDNIHFNIHLREYKSMTRIDQIEEEERSELRFWEPGMKVSQLLARFRRLKYALNKIGYGIEDAERMEIWKYYSKYAISEVCEHHVLERDEIYKKLGKVCLEAT